MTRLHALLSLLQQREFRRFHANEGSFKPSNVNIKRVLEYIDRALENVSQDLAGHPLAQEVTVRLEYVKTEITNDTPAWKSVVGALVIVATILGGVAAAPEAYQNVKAALDHILGTSIEKTFFHDSTPLLPKDPDEDWNEDSTET